ncbi:hypothetical protein PIB30_110897, partial [Stylosanthes scabra]|nr:hypothetical protein [Stylosanthes scabra]
QNFDNGLLFYTVYSSATETRSEFVALEGNLTRLGSEYISINGEVSWINYSGDTYQSPESVITYSMLGKAWKRLIISGNCKIGASKLLHFKGKVSLASYPTAKDQYGLVVRSITQKSDGSLKWKLELNLEGLRLYEEPKFFIGEDLITLTDDTEDDGTGLRQILLSRILESEDYLRRHLQCGRWPVDLNIQSIAPHCQGLFPI